jgi:xylan 1,4-beta-xylosidase
MANGEYVIANSTFEYYPGVELHRSSDLVHWQSVPSPLSEKRLLDMYGEKCSCGIWAPCISYSNGLYWLIYTNVRNWLVGTEKDTPNFLITAPSIEGPWSNPIFMNASGFDASMFHDDDGKHWYINMEWDYRESGTRQFSGVVMREYDAKQKKLVGERKKIFLGSDIGYVEGPHLYKQNGWYYVAAAEGGTEYAHALSVGRSKKIDGPYEIHPSNPLISSYGHPELKLQKAGHGSWCSSIDGEKTYLVYLCGRPLPNTKRCVLGRETALAEIVWKNDWPYVIQPDGRLNNIPPDYVEISDKTLDTSNSNLDDCKVIDDVYNRKNIKYTFYDKSFLKDFKTLRIPFDASRFSLTDRIGWLRIQGGQSPWSCYEQSVIVRRQEDFCFEAETKIEFEPNYFQQYAGLIYRYDEEKQYLLQITYDEEKKKVLQLNTIMPGVFEQGVQIKIPENTPLFLKLIVTYGKAEFFWSQDGEIWHTIRPLCDASKLSDDYGVLGFTGAFVGMFCVDTELYKKTADFKYFSYRRILDAR